MKLINEVLKKDPDYLSLLNEVERGRLPIVCTGLSLIHKAIIAAALRGHMKKRVVLITHDEATAAELCGEKPIDTKYSFAFVPRPSATRPPNRF